MSFDAAMRANCVTQALRAYDPGHDLPALRLKYGDRLVELGSNETSWGPSPCAIAAIRMALPEIFRYPDPKGAALKRALARRYGVDMAQITLGNGSHELLMLLAQCFAEASTSVIFSQYGFSVFSIASAAAGAQPICVAALASDHPSAPRGHDLPAMVSAIRADTALVYLANPNNPTGTWFDDSELDAFVAAVPDHVLIVVDEAYGEYLQASGTSSSLRLLSQYPNIVVTRTFSKAYALAGLRVGYAVSSLEVAAILDRLRESFNVNHLGLVAAEAALADTDYVMRLIDSTRNEREWLATQLHARGLRVLPSQTNFLLVDFGVDAKSIEVTLLRHAVVVRPMTGYGLPTCLRISVGTRAENARLLDVLA